MSIDNLNLMTKAYCECPSDNPRDKMRAAVEAIQIHWRMRVAAKEAYYDCNGWRAGAAAIDFCVPMFKAMLDDILVP